MSANPPPSPPQIGVAPPPPAATDKIVDEWFARFICNSPASRVTEVVNYLAQTALPALKQALKG